MAPAVSFPAKLTMLLKRRYDKGLGGFIILPCELIDRNGDNLKRCVLAYAVPMELLKNELRGLGAIVPGDVEFFADGAF